MKLQRLFLLVTLLFAAAVLPAVGARNYVDLFGSPAPASAAMRTIVIYPDTSHINVEGGEIVQFAVGDQKFTWHFNVAHTVRAFDLNEVFPAGMLDHVVRAYVTPDPRYLGP